MKGLNNKRILIGGGATGIGAAAAERLAAHGARLLVGDINEPALNGALARLRSKNAEVHVKTFDLGDESSIRALVADCIERLGGIDGVVIPGADLSKATAGNDHEVGTMDGAIWLRTLTVNLLGHALLMQAAIPHLIAAGGGSIVTLSSGAAHLGGDSMPAYAASKAGLHALIRHVARKYGKQSVRCNAVSPGLVATENGLANLSPQVRQQIEDASCLPRLGRPQDVAAMIAFLISEESSWITGQVFSVNGGLILRE